MRSSLRALFFAALSTASFLAASAQEHEPIVVFAAASLTDALQVASDAYTRASGTPVRLSFAASSALAKQIETGARADVFFPADQTWMDYLQQKEMIRRDSRVDLLANRLALIAPNGSTVALKLGPNAQIAAALGAHGRLATGDPDSVPIGIHAKAALIHLDQWSSLEPKLVRADNVRVALMYVARGEAALGIVYTTDAAAEPRVKIVDVFPDGTHPPIVHPVALTRTARAGADAYIKFLRGPQAAAIFTAAGFKVISDSKASTQACTAFQFDVSKELKLLSGAVQAVAAGSSGKTPPTIELNQPYQVTLSKQGTVRFVKPPGKATVNADSYAGLLRVSAGSATTLRVSLSQAAWIDVLDGGRATESTRHTGSHDCPLLRKSVEFKVTPDKALLIQFSGSAAKEIRLIVS